MGKILDEWKQRYYAQVPAHGITRSTLEEASAAFLTFLELPEVQKSAICRTMDSGANKTRIDIGYMKRSAAEDPDGEEKMYFHYHPDVETVFASAILVAGEKAKQFLSRAQDVWQKTLDIGKDAIQEFETEWPGVGVRFLPSERAPRLVIRFLAYHKTKPGNFLAKAHYDRGTFTIALGESAPGLRIGDPLVEVEHSAGTAIVMPATGFQIDVSAAVKPAWHDVVQRPEAELSANTARWAIVGFFDIQNGSYVPIEKTHTQG
jgi:isopenicillin N synthase-like dioxygenase